MNSGSLSLGGLNQQAFHYPRLPAPDSASATSTKPVWANFTLRRHNRLVVLVAESVRSRG